MERKDHIHKRTLAWACAAAAAVGAPGLILPETASAAPFGSRWLDMHDQGRDVRKLQRKLDRLGIDTYVDGYFGRGTRRSVRTYERREDLRVDGRVSKKQARGIKRKVRAARAAERKEREEFEAAQPAPLRTTPGDKAVLSKDGRTALAPENAPQEVKDAIAAANRITDKPYRYGGGHGRWEDSGYDCSGAVSYALHGAGLLKRSMPSGGFETYGKKGKGEWITVFANGGHAYLIIAGLRFDTSGKGERGPRWRPEWRSGRNFVKRHPAGL